MRDIINKLEEMNVEKPQLNEGLGELAHEAEKDHEVQMARSDLYKIAKYAVAIHKMLKDRSEMDGLEGWVQSKITKSADYMGAVKHYMEGEIMADVELAVVPVAGDMTDAMTMPEESVEVIEAEERDYICVHAKKGKYECSGTSSYAAAKKAAEHWGLKSTAGIDAHLVDEKKTATESVEVTENTEKFVKIKNVKWDVDNILDDGDLPKNIIMKIDIPDDADEFDIENIIANDLTTRYGFVHDGFDSWNIIESVEEGRNDGPMSECCDAPLDGFENGLGRCSDCGEMAGAWNADELDEAIISEKDTMITKLPPRTSQADRDAAIAAAPGVPAGTKGTSLDAWKGGKIPANIANNPTYKSEPGKAWIKQQQAAAKKHFGEEQVAEEDVIGDIISKLEKMGVKGKTPQKPRTSSMPLPKPKPAEPIGSDPKTGATKGLPPEEVYSPQQLQQIANQNRITKPALKKESKFADWSKK